MLLNKNEIIRAVESYLRDAGISAEDKAAIVQTVIFDAEVAVMEIIRRRTREKDVCFENGKKDVG